MFFVASTTLSHQTLGNVHTEPTSPFQNIVKVLYDNTEQFMYLLLEKIRKGEEGRWKIRRNGSKQSTQKKSRKEKKH
jgi:hypothetical protein